MIKLSIFLLVVATALACNIVKNNLPLIDQEPQLVKEVANGQKFIIGDPTDPKGNYLYIANLKGTPQEMGKAYGQLFAEEMNKNLEMFYKYYGAQIEEMLAKKLPAFMAKKLTGGALSLLHRLLDLNIQITKRYTSPRFYE